MQNQYGSATYSLGHAITPPVPKLLVYDRPIPDIGRLAKPLSSLNGAMWTNGRDVEFDRTLLSFRFSGLIAMEMSRGRIIKRHPRVFGLCSCH